MSNDRRAEAAGRRLDLEAAGRSGAWADPYMAGALARGRFDQAGLRLETGLVVDVVPGAHSYVVAAGRDSSLWCSPGGGAGFGVSGCRPLATYGINTFVVIVRHADDPGRGVILGAVPDWSTHHANRPADTIWPFQRTGQQVEAAHQQIQRMAAAAASRSAVPLGSAEVADYSAGRPHEATSSGEWGAMAETGVGVFADPFQVYLRVDETTGVFGFYPDSLLRLAGHNLQTVSVLYEDEDLEDEGELRGYTVRTVYPWEPWGLWRHNQVTPGWSSSAVEDHGLAPGQGTKFNNPYEVLTGSGDGVREPEYHDQIAAGRRYEWSGYLGQGGLSIVAGPVQLDWAYPSLPGAARTASVDGVERSDAPSGRLSVNGAEGPASQPYAVPPNRRGGPDQPGLFSDHKTVTGSWHVRAARRVLITKRVVVPTPRPVRRPEDPAGDSPAGTYKPSGLNDDGTAAHAVAAELATPAGAPHKGVILPDVIAYAFNWEDLHPFAYHEEDWSVAEEGAAGWDAVNQQTPDYADLALQQFLETPEPIFLDVDHRYGLAPYYETEAGLALLDDGSVVLYAGDGSELRLGGGNVELRCAGDVAMFPGRNLIGWAGHDVNLKAHDTMDLAAVNGDMFHRAQYKYHALSGNGGCGGFVFENKSVCPAFDFTGRLGADTVSSGFAVICPESAFLVSAQDVNVTLTDTTSDGRIVLDAGNSRHIYTRGKTHVHRVSQAGSILHLFDGTAAPSANEFAESYTLFGQPILVRGGGYFSGCLSAGEWITAGEHFASARAVEFNHSVPFGDPHAADADADVDDRHAVLMTYRTNFLAQTLVPPGFEDVEFTHRTSAQYRTSDFTYWESRWQSMATAGGQTLWSWSEPVVEGTVSGSPTYAHPGERRLVSGSYKSVAPTFVDPGDGWTAIPRGANRADYEAGDVAAPTSAALSSAYKVSTPAG